MTARGDTAVKTLTLPELESENRRLREMIGLGARLEWGFVAAEAIPAVPSQMVRDPLVLNLTLTAGRNVGVEPFTPVVTPLGLVGMVQAVDATTSLAITYSHPDFRVSAMTVDEQAFGIVQPYLGARERSNLLEMRGVPFRSPLKSGAVIVSSGAGRHVPARHPRRYGAGARSRRRRSGHARTCSCHRRRSPTWGRCCSCASSVGRPAC
jgi:rod shape-determining protein MreC